MDLSVLIVSHDSNEFLDRCLSSIPEAAGGLACETIVVDNASQTLGEHPTRFPQVRWVQNQENVGMGVAINQAARLARGRLLVILNPDTKFLPGALTALEEFFRERSSERVGFVGGALLFEDGSPQPSCGPFPSVPGMAWRLLLPRTRRKYYLGMPEHSAPVDWVTGAFMAARKVVFDGLGGFDPGFFLYYEDVDLCRRAHQAGMVNYFLPRAQAFHYRPHAVRGETSPELKAIIAESRRRYFKKHGKAWESWALDRLSGLVKA